MRKRIKGTLTTWNDARGFGFITPIAGGERIFVHIKAFPHRQPRPRIGQTVSFSRSQDQQGRPCAEKIRFTKTTSGRTPHLPGSMPAIWIPCLFFALLGGLIFILRIIPSSILVLYAVASAITYIAYAIDKRAAINGRWRTAEATLHTLSLLGGWPGALIAQQTLHHKSRKKGFQIMYGITVMINLLLTAWILCPRGPEMARIFFEKISP